MKINSRLPFFSVLILMALIVSGCGEKSNTVDAGNSDQNYNMKLALNEGPGMPEYVAAEKFAELVKEKTDGKVEVDLFPSGQLGDTRTVVEGLNLGQNEIVLESIGTLSSYSDLANIDAVPFLFEDYEHFDSVWNGDIGQDILDKIGEDASLKLIAPQYRGVRITTSKEKFETLEELKGLKIRAPQIDIYIKTWERLGANPTPMGASEIYTGIQQGTVDAQENPITTSYNYALYEVNPYLMLTNHVYSASAFIFSKDYFDELPENIQEAIQESALEAAEHRNQFVIDNEHEFIEKFKAKGVEIVELDLEPFREKFEGFVEEVFPDLTDYTKKIRE